MSTQWTDEYIFIEASKVSCYCHGDPHILLVDAVSLLTKMRDEITGKKEPDNYIGTINWKTYKVDLYEDED